MKFIGAHIFDYDATFRGDITIEGNLTISNSASQIISFGDNDFLNFGNNNDLRLVHDGGDSFIENNTGDLKIIQKENDADIRFFCDDGTGSVAEYFRLDGGDSITKFNKHVLFGDSTFIYIGAGFDFHLSHNGNSFMQNATGDLTIRQNADGKDLILECDDGSGGTTAYLTLDGSTTHSYFSAGNVGIGTSSPSNKLHVVSDDNVGTTKIISAYSLSGTQHTFLGYNSIVGSHSLDISTLSTQPIAFNTNNSEKMRLTSSGTLGIATTNPDTNYKLDVNGKAQVRSVLELDDVLTLNAISTPADPAANQASIYMDSADGAIKAKIRVGDTVVTRTLATFE